ncbi:MAG: HIT family protein [Candidatus Azobacteroides sp.]|nr:HIT family protein [Candidatus Azobacteroides sp.]
MKSPDCFYCQKNETLSDLMLEVAKLDVSTVYLFKEQTYRGRCLVAYDEHVNELFELSDEKRNAFMKDVAQVAQAMSKAFAAKKINYGAYSDKLSHLHFHLVPKYEDGPSFGSTFEMNPQCVYLSDEEYSSLIEKVKNNL